SRTRVHEGMRRDDSAFATRVLQGYVIDLHAPASASRGDQSADYLRLHVAYRHLHNIGVGRLQRQLLESVVQLLIAAEQVQVVVGGAAGYFRLKGRSGSI